MCTCATGNLQLDLIVLHMMQVGWISVLFSISVAIYPLEYGWELAYEMPQFYEFISNVI